MLVELLCCLGHSYQLISSIAWLVPLEAVCIVGLAHGVCFNGYDVPLLVSCKWILVFCITYTVKLSAAEAQAQAGAAAAKKADVSWLYGFYSVYSLFGWWVGIMSYYMVRHLKGTISLKSFQKEAIVVYFIGFVLAIGSAVCYALFRDDMQAFGKAGTSLAESQTRGKLFHRISICLFCIAAKFILFAFWIVFTASSRTLRHRRGAERPKALTPTQPQDRAVHSHNRGWSWVVDADVAHEPTWYLGDIERVGARDDQLADDYSSADCSMDGYVDQSEYLTMYWLRKLTCCKSKHSGHHADIPNAPAAEIHDGCFEHYCCCGAGNGGAALCCQGIELNCSDRRSARAPRALSRSDADVASTESTSLLSRR